MQTTMRNGCSCDGRRAAIGDIFVCGRGAPERTALEPSSKAGRLNGKERRRVMLCAQVDSASFSHKRAITFERLYTGTKVFLCPPVHILMISLPICPALFAVIKVRSATCSPHAAKTSMPVHHLPAPTCHDDMHAWLCACALPRCHRRPSIRLIYLDVICACPHICVCSGAIAIPGMPAFAPICSSAHPLLPH